MKKEEVYKLVEDITALFYGRNNILEDIYEKKKSVDCMPDWYTHCRRTSSDGM